MRFIQFVMKIVRARCKRFSMPNIIIIIIGSLLSFGVCHLIFIRLSHGNCHCVVSVWQHLSGETNKQTLSESNETLSIIGF